MKRLTDTQYLILGLIGLVAVAYFLAIANPAPSRPAPLSARSDERDGALALRLWLEQSNYSVQTFTDSVDLSNLDLLLILNPPIPYSPEEARDLRDWVTNGGHLIMSGNSFRLGSLLSEFDISLGSRNYKSGAISLTSPLLESPSVQNIYIESYYPIENSPDTAVTHVADDTDAVIVSYGVDNGTVWFSGSSYPFTNEGLQEGNNAGLILNMLGGLPRNAIIGFDEALRLDEPSSLLSWLFNSAPGIGILLSMVLTMTFLAMRGRRFGRPIPLPEDRLLREPVEYIQAMANLYRRSGQRSVILAHYKTQLKRQLCERYGLRLSIADEDLIQTISDRNPDIDIEELSNLIRQLSAQKIKEQELVSIAVDTDNWLRRHIG